MPDGSTVPHQPVMDPMGRPIEGRRRQALTSLSIVVSWVCVTVLIFWATRGAGPAFSAQFFAGMACVAWLCAEAFGTRRKLVWPTSALAIAGSLSVAFSVGLATQHLREPGIVASVAIITGVSALSMATYLFRFRLPGLVSPIITFTIISLFLTSYGLESDGLSRLEGISPRGILAALIASPIWMTVFGTLGFGALLLARWLDLNGDDFGLASARPLHLVGAGISALIVGRLLGQLPLPWDLLGLGALWIGGMMWAARINRFAVMVAIHLAIARPFILGLSEFLSTNSLTMWRPDIWEWTALLTTIAVIDFLIWPFLHKLSLALNWTLGPGGRIPQPRPGMGFWWRYWPYA